MSHKVKKYFYISAYLVVPIFFIILYLMMYMTYEDINQFYGEQNYTITGILYRIYRYIPRVGEFFQHIAVHFMTIQTSFGLDLLFRLVIAANSWLLIYLTTFMIIKHKPGYNKKDIIIYLGLFLVLMFSEVSEVFTYRFSYANNYILGLDIVMAFLLPFRLHIVSKKQLYCFGMIILGFLFGITSEIIPLAFVIIVFGWLIINFLKHKISIKKIWHQYRLQFFGVLGIFLGLIFFYVGGGLSVRTNGNYAEVYDYVSIFGIFNGNFIVNIYKIYQHIWYNMRYLIWAFFVFAGIIIIETILVKAKISKASHNKLHWYMIIFCVLFLAASSQIAVHDDMYPRYMFSVYVAIIISIFDFVYHILNLNLHKEKIESIIIKICFIMSVIAIIDIVFAFSAYHIKIDDKIDKIHLHEDLLIIEPVDYCVKEMVQSPIFRIMQLTPFDWGDNEIKYMKYGMRGICPPF